MYDLMFIIVCLFVVIPVTINIRDSFVPSKGHVLISADFSQLELRIMAHFSKYARSRLPWNGSTHPIPCAHTSPTNFPWTPKTSLFVHVLISTRDPKLLNILSQPGDIFILMASSWKNKPPSEVTSADRAQTKHICYGILYGMGPTNLAAEILVSKDEVCLLFQSVHVSSYS